MAGRQETSSRGRPLGLVFFGFSFRPKEEKMDAAYQLRKRAAKMDRRALMKVSAGAVLASAIPAAAFAALPTKTDEVMFRVVFDTATGDWTITRIDGKNIEPMSLLEYCKREYPHKF